VQELGETLRMAQTARESVVATLVVVGVLALALALWKLKLVVFLVCSASSSQRP
jgi:uncharacterized membrane protein YidH (DUF202 family)